MSLDHHTTDDTIEHTAGTDETADPTPHERGQAEAVPATMRAATFDRYGPPEVVEPRRIPVPEPAADEVLIRVGAAGINPYDWHHYRGEPLLFVRPTVGVRRPRQPITVGADVAGVIEEVGAAVTGLSPGDRVYGEVGFGTCAEFVAASADRVAPMPTGLTFEQAAALPMGALTALQALRDGRFEAGQRVLVNGASGGVGNMVVQLARAMGAASVTGVCSTRNLELVTDLGADRVVDYTRDDVAAERGHDLVIDTVGSLSTRALAMMVQPGGTVVLIGGGRGRWVEPGGQVVRGLLQSPFLRGRVTGVFTVDTSPEALGTITAMVEAGSVTPVVERTYALDDVVAAMHHLETGHVRGKLVVIP